MGNLVAGSMLPVQLFLCRTSVIRPARGRRRKKGSGIGKGREGVGSTTFARTSLVVSLKEAVSPRAQADKNLFT